MEPPTAVVPDLAIPLPGEVVRINRTDNVKEASAARWTGTDWAFKVGLENGEQVWVTQSDKGISEGWKQIPEPSPLATPVSGT